MVGFDRLGEKAAPSAGNAARQATMLLAALLAGCATSPKNLNLELRVSNRAQFSRQLGGFGLYAWGPEELGLMLVGTGFSDPRAPVEARFSSDFSSAIFMPAGRAPVSLSTQSEVAIFTRDPQEAFATFTAIGDNPAEWDRQLTSPHDLPLNGSTAVLPDVAMMPFGPAFGPGMDPNHPLVFGPIQRQSFWLDGGAGAPGAAPAGDGSTKGVRIYPVGMCSSEVPLKQLLDQVTGAFTTAFRQSVCRQDGLIPDMQYTYAATYLSHPSASALSTEDGFLLASHLRVHDNGVAPPLSFDDCNVSFNYAYRIGLKDGILGLDAHRNTFANDSEPLCTGFLGRKGMADIVADALALDLPNAMARVASSRQVVPILDLTGQPVVCDSQQNSDDPCFAGVAAFETAIRIGTQRLGLGSQVLDQILAVSSAHDPNTGKAHWNYQCVTPPNQSQGQCRFTLRAKRVNVLPDAIETVWFDEGDEYSNTGFAAFVASFASSNPSTWRQLCSRTPSNVGGSFGDNSGNYYPRRWAKSFVGHQPDCPTN
jgi:hypothetical protein